MHPYLKFILPAYMLLYFVLLLIMPALIVGKKIGKNPVVISATDDAHGLIAKYFSLCLVSGGFYVVLFAMLPTCYAYLLPISYLESDSIIITGLLILVFSLVWTAASQINMQASWRVGIDNKQKTALVTEGIFRFSRNPIYLGMIASFVGLFLITPNAFTLIILIVGNILIQIQVRLEEEFLYRMHGRPYLDYKKAVRRFI